jgi:hypothetical protein
LTPNKRFEQDVERNVQAQVREGAEGRFGTVDEPSLEFFNIAVSKERLTPFGGSDHPFGQLNSFFRRMLNHYQSKRIRSDLLTS